MNIGFYYHIAVNTTEGGFKLPSYLGLFIDSLAGEIEQLTLFMHEASDQESAFCDYALKGKNIKFVGLGKKTPAWERFIWPNRTLKKISHQIKDCDIILVRAPSPLAPAFNLKFKKNTKISYLVVGDYVDGAKHLDQPFWRKIPIYILSIRNDRQLSNALKSSKTIVNSEKLFQKYKSFVNELYQIKTTTLSVADFYIRHDTCQAGGIRILYTGSFSFAKGLVDLLNAFSSICKSYSNVTLHFVGWEYDESKPVEKYLKNRASDLGLLDKVFFHGFKSVGNDLNEMYRMADIYIIPSYHEGFPRTIWEAMANGLPVIATNVGSIPYFLKDRQDALLIKPGDINAISDAVNELIINEKLRKNLIANGLSLAKSNTLEIQAKLIISILRR